MGTPADKLDYLLDTKEDIKSAIKSKGQSVTDSDTFRSYGDKIRAISTSDSSAPTVNISAAGKVTATSSGGTTTKTLSSTYDPDFISSNIKSGVTVFGLIGTYSGGTPVVESCSSGRPVATPTGMYTITLTVNQNIKTLCGLSFYMQLTNGYTIVCGYPTSDSCVLAIETCGETVKQIMSPPTISGTNVTFYVPAYSVCATFLGTPSFLKGSSASICYVPA